MLADTRLDEQLKQMCLVNLAVGLTD